MTTVEFDKLAHLGQQAKAVLCSSVSEKGGTFAVAELQGGKIAVTWGGHSTTYESEQKLIEASVLNTTEKELLRRREHVN